MAHAEIKGYTRDRMVLKACRMGNQQDNSLRIARVFNDRMVDPSGWGRYSLAPDESQGISDYKNVSSYPARYTIYANQGGSWVAVATNQPFTVGQNYYNSTGTVRITITSVGGASYTTETATFLTASSAKSAAQILSADDDDVLMNMNSII